MYSITSLKLWSAFCILLSILSTGLTNKLSLDSEEMDTLQMVHVLYRHGDRAPIKLYPNDPNKDQASTIWPGGLGQLTKIGKAMEYKLGSWLRNRYKNFMSDVFKPEEINIVSTNFDRTLMSAQCVLASFYYPDNETRFIEELRWVPTPIHTAPDGDDKLLNLDSACPRVSREEAKLKDIPEIIKFYEKNKGLFHYLSEMSGLNLTTALEVDFLFDTLKIEKLYNLTIPSWGALKYNDMKAVSDFSFKLNTYSHELKRLRGGPLISAITSNMYKKSHGKLANRKMMMYSAHDSTVAILLNTMGVYNDLAPPYAATVLFELHLKNKEYFIKIFYQNDSAMISAPHPLTIPSCTHECPLQKWTDLLADVTPKDWDRECYRPDPVRDHYYIVGLTGWSSFLTIVLLVEIIWLVYKRCEKRLITGFEPLAKAGVKPTYGAIGKYGDTLRSKKLYDVV